MCVSIVSLGPIRKGSPLSEGFLNMSVCMLVLFSLVEHVVRFALGTRCSIEARGHSKDRTLLTTIAGAISHTHAHVVTTFGLELLAHANANKHEHEDNLGSPDPCHGQVVVSHHPNSVWSRARGFNSRCHAHHCIIGIEEDATNDQDDELDAAADVGAVGREDSCSPPPSSDERAKHVEGEETKGDLVDIGDNTKTRTKLLAIHVAVFHDSDMGLQSVQVAVLTRNNGSFDASTIVSL